ncbi:MAG: hypothetical protein ACI4RD_00400 [Kiritimatiellia bacterium]
MIARLCIAAAVVAWGGVGLAATVETSAEFALDNVLASRLVRSGERVTAVRDAAWAEGGVTFTMTGKSDEVLTDGLREDVVMPAVAHLRIITLGLRAGDESYAYSYLVADGEPNRLADTAAEFPLDSRTGMLRVAKPRELLAYSTRWSAGAGAATIAIAGPDGSREELAYVGEGVHAWHTRAPYRTPSLPSGRYCLTFSDGVERFDASFRIPSEALILLLK